MRPTLWCIVFFVKRKTEYELRISDWSSYVCSSDLQGRRDRPQEQLCARTQADVRGCNDHRLQDQRLCARHDARRHLSIVRLSRARRCRRARAAQDRKSVVSGKSVSVRVDPGGRRIIKKKRKKNKKKNTNKTQK